MDGSLPDLAWNCPVCKETLLLEGRSWRCSNGHCFDCAKEGYVNLLLAQHKNSKEPGDNKDMVLARQAFLKSGAYGKLAHKLASLCNEYMQSKEDAENAEGAEDANHASSFSLFDVGCSEGYYSSHIHRTLLQNGISMDVGGLDISKPAIQKAAKSHPENRYCVGSSYNIPLSDNSIDVALQVFAPASTSELQRVLKPSGMWLLVEPAPAHLSELKAFVYERVQEHTMSAEVPAGFYLAEQIELNFDVVLKSDDERLNLLKMTPFYWRISPENKQKLLANLKQVGASFLIKGYVPATN